MSKGIDWITKQVVVKSQKEESATRQSCQHVSLVSDGGNVMVSKTIARKIRSMSVIERMTLNHSTPRRGQFLVLSC